MKAPLLDRLIRGLLDAAYRVVDPLERWLARRGLARLRIAATPTPDDDEGWWRLERMQSGEPFTMHFAKETLRLRDRGVVEAWLLVAGYEALGNDTWRSRPKEEGL